MKKQLITLNGTVEAYLLKPEGQVNGLLLTDGKQLHLPPHLSAALQEAVKPGDTIEATVEPGESSPLGEEFRTQRLTNTETGNIVADQPPAPSPKPGEPLSVEGNVMHWLVGHKGEPLGFILADGIYLHIPPHIGKNLTHQVKIGDRLSAEGYGTRNDFGISLTVETLKCNEQPLVDLSVKGSHHHKHAADHYELAAHHHRKAAKHSESGEREKAAEHVKTAHVHQKQALKHTEEADKQYAPEHTGA
ncbi:MAG: hypothetical protein PUP93_32305 [Rhizonema sp. NSF051]|nr:hypothetical protein [Rhizonema sp. NSF051]